MVDQLDLLSGEHLRDEGTARVDANEDDAWKAAVDVAIERLAHECRAGTRETFTAEDVRDLAGDPPNHANAMGARFLRAVKAGTIVGVGWTRSSRPAAHACRLQLYKAGEGS